MLGGAGCAAPAARAQFFAPLVSPDGRSVYVRGSDALLVFDRNTDTGALTQKAGDAGCLTESAVATCKDVVGLGSNGFQLAIDPAGKQLYVPIQSPGGVSTFDRLSDGSLLQRVGTDGGCITTDGSTSGVANVCKDGNDAMTNGLSVIIDPTGHHVYLGATAGVFTFSRDPETGLLSIGDCVTESAEGGAKTAELSVHWRSTSRSPLTGANCSSTRQNGIGFLLRNASTGALTQRAGTRGCLSASGLGGLCETFTQSPGAGYGGVVVSNNGLRVYAGAHSTGTVAVFDQDFPPIPSRPA